MKWEWVRPFELGQYEAPPITQPYAHNWPGVEPLGYLTADGRIYTYQHPDAKAGNFHRGVDYGLPQGYRIRAPASGIVVEEGFDTGWGANVIRVKQGPFVHTFGHCSGFLHTVDTECVEDDILGLTGGTPGTAGAGNSSGPHLHWEVWSTGLGCFVPPSSHLVRRVYESG